MTQQQLQTKADIIRKSYIPVQKEIPSQEIFMVNADFSLPEFRMNFIFTNVDRSTIKTLYTLFILHDFVPDAVSVIPQHY